MILAGLRGLQKVTYVSFKLFLWTQQTRLCPVYKVIFFTSLLLEVYPSCCRNLFPKKKVFCNKRINSLDTHVKFDVINKHSVPKEELRINFHFQLLSLFSYMNIAPNFLGFLLVCLDQDCLKTNKQKQLPSNIIYLIYYITIFYDI